MRILVTGAAGFVGKRLLATSAGKGYGVFALVRDLAAATLPETMAENLLHVGAVDLTNRDALQAVIADVQPKAIFHLAARIPQAADEGPFAFFEDNVRGTLNLLEAANNVGVDHVVLSSSMSVYGTPKYLPLDEDHPTVPDGAYGISKLEGEWYGRLYAQKAGLAVTVLRYSGIFGQGQRGGAIPAFIARCLDNAPILLHSGGRPSSDFVWVEDVVQANLLALDSREQGCFRVFNIGSGIELSIRQLAELIRETTGSSSEIQFSDTPSPREFRFDYDISRARADLGYSPTPIHLALEQCVEQWRTNQWH